MASGRAGLADEANTQSVWSHVEIIGNTATQRNRAEAEDATTPWNWAQVGIMDKVTTQSHRTPVTDTFKCGSKVSTERLPNTQNPAAWKTTGRAVKKSCSQT